MNAKIVEFLKRRIAEKGMKYIFISRKTGIDYQRLNRIFNQNAALMATELLYLCRLLEVDTEDMIGLLDGENPVELF